MFDFVIGKSQKSHILNIVGGKIVPKINVQHYSFIRGWITFFFLSLYQTRLECIYKSQIKKVNHRNHIFHTFLVENAPK